MNLSPEDRKKLETLGIVNLGEVCYLVSHIIHKSHEAYVDDGKVGIWEGAGILLSSLDAGKEALADISKVVEEALYIRAEGVEALADILYPSIVGSLLGRPYAEEMVNRVIGLAVQLVHVIALIRDKDTWIPRVKIVAE